jgi:hypothetical protein
MKVNNEGQQNNNCKSGSYLGGEHSQLKNKMVVDKRSSNVLSSVKLLGVNEDQLGVLSSESGCLYTNLSSLHPTMRS